MAGAVVARGGGVVIGTEGMPVAPGASLATALPWGHGVVGTAEGVVGGAVGVPLSSDAGVVAAPPITPDAVAAVDRAEGTASTVVTADPAEPAGSVAFPARGSASALPPPPITESGATRARLSTPAASASPPTAKSTRLGRGLRCRPRTGRNRPGATAASPDFGAPSRGRGPEGSVRVPRAPSATGADRTGPPFVPPPPLPERRALPEAPSGVPLPAVSLSGVPSVSVPALDAPPTDDPPSSAAPWVASPAVSVGVGVRSSGRAAAMVGAGAVPQGAGSVVRAGAGPVRGALLFVGPA
ncbi:hypothetical protein BKI49_23070 [Streptomyces sp. Tue6028]|nr:hypothetical protein BKI49_23070 [Streptomyces sp. Tue6028]